MLNGEDGYPNGTRAPGVPFYGGRRNFSQGEPPPAPQHIEAEQGVLAAILLDEEGAIADKVLEMLTPDDFYRWDHQTIFAAMKRLYERGRPVDLTTLIDELGREQYDQVGGDIYFETNILQSRARVPNGVYYAEIIKHTAAARELAEANVKGFEDVYSNQFTTEQLFERARSRIEAIEAAHAPADDDTLVGGAPLRMGEAAFRGLAGCIIECIREQTEACAEAILIQFLVAIGNLFGPKPHFTVGGKGSRCNLYSCLVGPSGCGKGMAWEAVRWMLGRVSSLFTAKPVLTGMTSGEGVIMELKEAGGNPVLAVETEFARTLNNLNRDGNSLDAILRQAFEDTTLRVPTKNNPVTADGAHLSVIGHIPEFELKGKMSSITTENGFAGRFLWARAFLFQLKPDGGNFGLVAQALELYEKALIAAVKFADELDVKHEYTRDPEAEALWQQVYRPLRVRPPGPYGSATSKAANLTMRLATIYAVLDQSHVVQLTHLESALAVWEYCDATAKALFGDSVSDRKMEKLMKAMEDVPGGMSRTKIYREVFRSHITKDELNCLLEAAQSSGNLVYKDAGTKDQKWMHSRYA